MLDALWFLSEEPMRRHLAPHGRPVALHSDRHFALTRRIAHLPRAAS